MHRSPLQTLDRRRARYYSQRRRQQRRGQVVALVVASALVLAGTAWGITRMVGAVRSSSDAAARSAPATATAGVVATATAAAPAQASPTAIAPPPPSRPPTVTICVVGDMLFSGDVTKLIAAQGAQAPLAGIAAHLSAADVTVGWLDGPLSNRGSADVDVETPQRSDPAALAALSSAGFDAVALANDHALDYGSRGLLDTISRLNGAKIAHAGAGKNTAAAWAPAIVERGGAKVAVLDFTRVVHSGSLASDNSPGVASGRLDPARVRAAIVSAASKSDYVVVMLHWGKEGATAPTSDQVKVAHDAIDAGADLVVGTHPHAAQALETYGRGLVAYSLGDLVRADLSRNARDSFILGAQLGPDGVANAVAVPYRIDSRGTPAFVRGSDALTSLTRLRDLSGSLDTSLQIAADIAEVAE